MLMNLKVVILKLIKKLVFLSLSIKVNIVYKIVFGLVLIFHILFTAFLKIYLISSMRQKINKNKKRCKKIIC